MNFNQRNAKLVRLRTAANVGNVQLTKNAFKIQTFLAHLQRELSVDRRINHFWDHLRLFGIEVETPSESTTITHGVCVHLY